MPLHPFHEEHDAHDERQKFLDSWQLAERALRRYAALVFIFVGGLIIALDSPTIGADLDVELTIGVGAGLIAVGFWFITLSRHSAMARTRLHFLEASRQRTYAWACGLGAAFAIWQATQTDRFLFLAVGGISIGLAVFFQWRAGKAHQYKTRFSRPLGGEAGGNDEGTARPSA